MAGLLKTLTLISIISCVLTQDTLLQQNFDINKFMGRWYVLYRSDFQGGPGPWGRLGRSPQGGPGGPWGPGAPWSHGSDGTWGPPGGPWGPGTDAQAVYTLNSDGTVNFTIRGYDSNQKSWRSFDTTAKVDPSRPARLSIRGPWNMELDHNVLYTDYDNVAAVYSKQMFDMAMIMGRQQNLPQDRIDQAFGQLEKVGISKSRMVKMTSGQAPSSK